MAIVAADDPEHSTALSEADYGDVGSVIVVQEAIAVVVRKGSHDGGHRYLAVISFPGPIGERPVQHVSDIRHLAGKITLGILVDGFARIVAVETTPAFDVLGVAESVV
jgi:hypothetical protein